MNGATVRAWCAISLKVFSTRPVAFLMLSYTAWTSGGTCSRSRYGSLAAIMSSSDRAWAVARCGSYGLAGAAERVPERCEVVGVTDGGVSAGRGRLPHRGLRGRPSLAIAPGGVTAEAAHG